MIIVTGGAGFIGANLVEQLAAEEHTQIVICDTLDFGTKWKNLLNTNFYDFINPTAIFEYIETHKRKIKAIIHLGAISATTEKNGELLLENNYRFSSKLWDFCTIASIPFIYASSAATYGNGDQGFSDDHALLSKLRPINAYGWSKHIFDIQALKKAEGHQTPPQWVGLKFFNVFGPYEYHKGEMMSLLCKSFDQIANDQPVNLFQSHRQDYQHGHQLRDFVWVKDCVQVILWFLRNPQVSGIYNLGTGQARSFYDLIAALFQACDKKTNISFIPMPEILRNSYQYFTQADMTKLRNAGCNYQFTPMEQAVAAYAGHLQSHYKTFTL